MSEYQVTALWWPDGWEPLGPLDVPKCIKPAHSPSSGQPKMSYEQALATVRGLNAQNMARPGATWYAVAAAQEGEEPAGEIEVVRPSEGSQGDCSHCPAHDLPCDDEVRAERPG